MIASDKTACHGNCGSCASSCADTTTGHAPNPFNNSTGHAATTNACKLCTPFGACLAFKGVQGAMTLLHGSQGCSTYIRRYMISHFREPIDIASSNFTEDTAIFGGQRNFSTALENMIRQYNPRVIGVATTCLSETIGDDVKMLLRGFQDGRAADAALPKLVHVSTPSYRGTHSDGYYAAIRALVEAFAVNDRGNNGVNILPGMISPEDLRHLREVVEAFTCHGVILPDYADTLDGPSWEEYHRIPEGGTPVEAIAGMAGAAGTLELYSCCKPEHSAGNYLETRFGVTNHQIGMPIGIRRTDLFLEKLAQLTGKPIPQALTAERGRLVDAYIDAHKYLFGKRAVVFGDEDMVAGLCGFLREIGVTPVLALSGGKSGRLREEILAGARKGEETVISDDADFDDMDQMIGGLKPDFLIGNSKGGMLARKIKVPLVRVGLPIHDRFGGARVQHILYRGTQQLFDRIVNTIIERNQDGNDWGYTYM